MDPMSPAAPLEADAPTPPVPSVPRDRRSADRRHGAAPPPVEARPGSAPRTSAERGAEERVLKPRRAAPADAVRPTRAEVNLASLRHNLRVVERRLAGSGAEVWGVLKADAYGHGAPAVARTLERAGMPGLCVALLEEGVELRTAGIRAPILIMGGYYGPRFEGLEELVAQRLTPVVYDPGTVERLAAVVRESGLPPAAIHVKVDTGMGRLGVPDDDAEVVALLDAVAARPELRLDGLMTHFACADSEDLEATRAQLRRFREVERLAAARGLVPRLRHAANSAALLRLPESRLDMVRPGIALFGVSPTTADEVPDLRPVVRVRTEVVALRTVRAGQPIGYGHTWRPERDALVATIPLGYADGLSRHLSNRGAMLVRGRRAPIVGTVSMDLTMVDLTDIPGARLGDEVVALGAQEGPLGKDAITAAEIAAHAGTIPWEVLTSISRRVPRFYREP